jgi:Zn-finger nucleic acid-binding protein
MSEITECPSCGGTVIDAGGLDVICTNCGATFRDLIEEFETEDMVERLVEMGIDPLDIDGDGEFY